MLSVNDASVLCHCGCGCGCGCVYEGLLLLLGPPLPEAECQLLCAPPEGVCGESVDDQDGCQRVSASALRLVTLMTGMGYAYQNSDGGQSQPEAGKRGPDFHHSPIMFSRKVFYQYHDR